MLPKHAPPHNTFMPSPTMRYWQSIALLAAVLPQINRVPLWLSGMVMLCVLWRFPALENRIKAPGIFLRMLLLVAGMAGVFYSHHSFFGPEGGVSFLMVCAILKMQESRTARDFFVSAILNFFVLATAFLFSQDLWLTLYVALASMMIVAALLVLQQRSNASVALTLRRASVMVLQAVPLMVVLFILFPRLPPLWTLNFSQGSGRTGMSDTMSPGDISKLSESSEVAFRVEFKHAIPAPHLLYWRGVTLTNFDGKTWSQDEGMLFYPAEITRPEHINAVNYRVILEPTDKPWLYSLAVPSSLTPQVLSTHDYRLLYSKPVFERLTYEVESITNASANVHGLAYWEREQNVRLPAAGNPETRKMAQRWRMGSGSNAQFVRDTLDWFRQEHFFYTLEPPALGDNRIDDFLFKTRRGFCEHYASSFVFLMRAAGVPARVVVGYQGGEKSDLANYWLVRQLDAHAWAEVWLEGQGWVSVDPTSAVAPQRIQKGAPQMAAQREYWGNAAGSTVRYTNYRLLKSLRGFADYVNYRWHRDVLGYNSEKQESLLMRVLGSASILRRVAAMGVAFIVLGALLFLWVLRGQRREMHKLDRIYRRYCERVARMGVAREAGEAPHDFARRVARIKPAQANHAKEFAQIYTALRYRPAAKRTSAADVALEKRLRRLARGRAK